MVAGRLVGCAPVVGQTVGGGELPGAGLLLAAKRLHLLPPSVLVGQVGLDISELPGANVTNFLNTEILNSSLLVH